MPFKVVFPCILISVLTSTENKNSPCLPDGERGELSANDLIKSVTTWCSKVEMNYDLYSQYFLI